MTACPVKPFPRALGFRESRTSGAAAVVSSGEGVYLRDTADAGWLCLCTLRFLRQILGVGVHCNWTRAGRGRHSGGEIRKGGLELGWRLMGGQGG